jgi:hypothetical protein
MEKEVHRLSHNTHQWHAKIEELTRRMNEYLFGIISIQVGK